MKVLRNFIGSATKSRESLFLPEDLSIKDEGNFLNMSSMEWKILWARTTEYKSQKTGIEKGVPLI